MLFKPQIVTGHIPEGDYEGVIREVSESFDSKYLWMKVEIDGMDEILNISVPLNSVVLNNYAMNFCNKKGEVDTDDFIDTFIEFTVADRVVGSETYSKFTKLSPIMEENEND